MTLVQQSFLQSVQDYVQSGAPFAKLRQLAEDADPRIAGYAIKVLLDYGIGTPVARTDPARDRQAVELGELIRQADLQAQADLAAKVAGGSENPSLSPARRSPALISPADGPRRFLPAPTPAEDQTSDEAGIARELAEWEEEHRR